MYPKLNTMKIVHDSNNSRVVTENDEFNLFYTNKLNCSNSIIDDVVALINENILVDDIIGSRGCVDEYLLNAECSQEDREEICEQLYITLPIYRNKFGLTMK